MKGTKTLTMLEFIFGRLLFRDAARPVEILSMLGLYGQAVFFFTFPDLAASRASYDTFSWFAPQFWAALFAVVGTLQLVTIVARMPARWKAELRFGSMALAAGLWALIAVAFWASGTQSTAHWNYTSIALLCTLTGLYLGWAAKTS